VLLSTSNFPMNRKMSAEESVRMIAEAGFDAVDLDLTNLSRDPNEPFLRSTYLSDARRLRSVGDDLGIVFNQSHAPFQTKDIGDPFTEQFAATIVRSVEIAVEMNIPIIVMHQIAFEPVTRDEVQRNYEFLNSLVPKIRGSGVKIAIENTRRYYGPHRNLVPGATSYAESFKEFMQELDPEYFTCCVDVGHCGLVGEDTVHMIRTLGHDLVKALHIQDNDSVKDSHLLPFMGSLDIHAIMSALKEIQYDGDLTFEISFSRVPVELYPASLRYMENIGRYLMTLLK